MAISYIGSATGAVTASLPAFTEAGDVLLLFAFRDGSTTAPTLAAGWTSLGTQTGTTCSGRLAYKLATGSSEAVGTWTNATSVVVQVYRGADPADPIGNVVPLAGTSSNTVQFPGITLSDTSGTSWCAAFVGHRSTAPDLTVAPTGFANRVLVSDATDEAAGHDTNGGVTGFAGQTVTVGGGSAQGWITYVAEVLAAAEAGGITGTASGGSDTAGSSSGSVGVTGTASGSNDTSGSSAGSVGSGGGGGGGAAFVRQFKVVESSGSVGLQVLTATLDQPTLAGSTLYAVVRSSIDSNSYAESQIVVGAPALQNDPSPPESFLTKLESLRDEALSVNCHQISSYRPNVAAGITQVSDYWTNTSGGNRIFSNYRWLIVFEIADVDPNPLIDSFGQIATVGAGTDNISAGAFTFSGAGLIVGVSNNESMTQGPPYPPNAGSGSASLGTYATYSGFFDPFGRAAYRDVAGAGSAAQTWSSLGSDEYFTHAIALRGSGSAPEGRTGTASGSAEASGSAAAAARIAGTGLDSASTTGSAAADVRVAATAAGSTDSPGSATGAVRIAALASATASSAGSASGSVGPVPATASAAGSADSTGSATAALPLAGTGLGSASTTGSAAADVRAAATAAGNTDSPGSAAGAVRIAALASATASIAGSASGSVGPVPATASAAGSADSPGSATAAAGITGTASGAADTAGSSAGATRIAASSTGTADTTGSATGTVPPPAGAITASGMASVIGNSLGTARIGAAGSGAAETPGSATSAAPLAATAAGSTTVTASAAATVPGAASASGSADTDGAAQAAGPGAAGDAIAAGNAGVDGAATGAVRAAAEAVGSAGVDGAASARLAARAASGSTVDADGIATCVVGIRAQGNGASDTGGLARGGQGFIPDPDRVIAVPGRSRVFIADARPLLRAVARPRIHVVLRG